MIEHAHEAVDVILGFELGLRRAWRSLGRFHGSATSTMLHIGLGHRYILLARRREELQQAILFSVRLQRASARGASVFVSCACTALASVRCDSTVARIFFRPSINA